MTMLDQLLHAINARKNEALCLAQASLPQSQFTAFRGMFLTMFGRAGLERELTQIVAEYEKSKGKDTGRPIHAGKEVPHD